MNSRAFTRLNGCANPVPSPFAQGDTGIDDGLIWRGILTPGTMIQARRVQIRAIKCRSIWGHYRRYRVA
jgi:hypothetical protein